jgi:hypothetical protein
MSNLELPVTILLLLIPYCTQFYKAVSISVRLSFTIVIQLFIYALMILWINYVKANVGIFMVHSLFAAIGILLNIGLIIFFKVFNRFKRT